jgi:acyl phosphate:glycerol-3-phosphate acyltransferase
MLSGHGSSLVRVAELMSADRFMIPEGIHPAFFVAAAGSYLLGCLATGFYLVRWRKGTDIRDEGSGSCGATNVSRELGKSGFIATFVLDLAKGALAAWLASYFGLGPWERLGCGMAVVAGHIWPAQLKFRGGKGVAPLMGVLLVSDPAVIGLMIPMCLVILAILRRFTLSGVITMALSPPAAALVLQPGRRALYLLVLVLPVLFAHRQNLREDVGWIGALFPGQSRTGNQERKEG